MTSFQIKLITVQQTLYDYTAVMCSLVSLAGLKQQCLRTLKQGDKGVFITML